VSVSVSVSVSVCVCVCVCLWPSCYICMDAPQPLDLSRMHVSMVACSTCVNGRMQHMCQWSHAARANAVHVSMVACSTCKCSACVNGRMQHVQMQCMLRSGDYIRAHAVVDADFPAAAFADTLQLLHVGACSQSCFHFTAACVSVLCCSITTVSSDRRYGQQHPRASTPSTSVACVPTRVQLIRPLQFVHACVATPSNVNNGMRTNATLTDRLTTMTTHHHYQTTTHHLTATTAT
jgi:hypothetical protein